MNVVIYARFSSSKQNEMSIEAQLLEAEEFCKRNEYTIAKYVARRLDYDLAKELYKMHSEESFYNDLCKYMSSDISVGYCLNYTGKGDPIEITNKLKDEIREQFGKDEMKNAIHSSDSEANVVREAKIYFK